MVKVSYQYDAYGSMVITDHTSINLGTINPYRYRGYRYDEESKLYYLQSRYYNPEIQRFISLDDISYLDPSQSTGLNLYAYTGNNPVMLVDPSGNFPILTILTITAFIGLGFTIGGVATENNTMTAIGLTLIAIPALVSGGLALFATSAVLTNIIGGVTIVAGLGTATFASAEWQQTFTGNNWMIDAGMSESWYNGLMITTAIIATLGTAASSFAYYHKINTIVEMWNLTGTEYKGFKFTQKAPSGRLRYRTFEFQTPHNGHGYHFQVNKFADFYHRSSTLRRWVIWK